MTRWEKVPLWGAVSLIWLGALVLIAGFIDHILALLTGTHPLGLMPVNACDLSHFCTNGESSVPMSWVSAASRYWTVTSETLTVLTLLSALILGTGIIRSISHGRGFAAQTVRRMGIVASILVAGGILSYISKGFADDAISRDSIAFQEAAYPDGFGIALGGIPTLPAALIFAGILAFALWAAFRQGTRMQEELDHVI